MAARTRGLHAPAPSARGRRRPLAPVDAFSRSLTQGLRRHVEERTVRASLADVDGWLLGLTAALCAFGLVMVYSASEALGYAWYHNSSYFFQKQALNMAGGAVLLIAAARLDYHRWRAWAPGLMLSVTVLLLLVLIPHLGTERLGARRWFYVGPVSVQPSALATLVAIVFFSAWFAKRGPTVRTWGIVRNYLILLSVLLLLVLLERDLGSAIVLAGAGVCLLALAGAHKRWLVVTVMLLLGAGWLAIKAESYRSNRLSAFRDPFADPQNTGYQTVQSLYALGSGGFHGVGLGNSVQKYQWLPEAHTDFIFAIIGEELGLLGTLSVIAAFTILAWRGVRACRRAPDAFGALLAGGITAWIGIQAFVNMAAVTNVVPTTGITLPFISSGGSSLVTTMLATGVLCNVSAQGRRQTEGRRAHVDRWRGDGGTPDARDGGGGRAPARRPVR